MNTWTAIRKASGILAFITGVFVSKSESALTILHLAPGMLWIDLASLHVEG